MFLIVLPLIIDYAVRIVDEVKRDEMNILFLKGLSEEWPSS